MATSEYGFLRPLLRGLPIIIGCMVAGMLAAKKYLLYTTPVYESTAKIKLADIHNGVANGNLYKDLDVFVSTNKIGAEVELLKSSMLVTKAVKKLGVRISISVFRVGEIHKTELYNESPFSVEAEIINEKWYDKPFTVNVSNDSAITVQTPGGDLLKGGFGKIMSAPGAVMVLHKNIALLQKRPKLQVADKYEVIVHSEEHLVNSIISGLDVMAVDKDVPVLRISYASPVPQKAADIVNTLSAAYITDYIDERFRSADTTADFLAREVKTYGNKLSASENAIERYRDNNNIINIRQETETDLRKIADLKKQSASLQMNLSSIDSLYSYIMSGKNNFLELAPNFEAFTDLLSTELVKKTKELQREKQDLLLRYTPENEKVKVIDEKIADINKYFIESIGNTRKSLQTQYTNLNQSIAEAEKVFIGLPSREKTMTILDRNFGLNEQIYRFLSEKRTEAEIAKAASISFHRIISEGEVPVKPVSPNTPIIKIMAVILGLMGGITFVYGVHALKGRVNNKETIERNSSTTVAAQIPFCKNVSRKENVFRAWAIQLELKKQLENAAVIAVSSFGEKEGKSFITQGLLHAIQNLDKSVVMVDCDDTIKGDLQKPVIWKKHLAELKKTYDVVLIKNSQLSQQSAALMVMADATLNLLVLDSRRTRKKRIQEADLMKEEFTLPGMHFVLNRAGYSPSLFTQLKRIFYSLFKRRSK